MRHVDKHEPGSFCWIELGTTDQAGAKKFYGDILGWTPSDEPIGPGKVYTIFKVDGRDAAAASTIPAEQVARGVRPHWLAYIAVEDADASTARAVELGATRLAGPFDVGTNGRMSMFLDPSGAAFAVWQAKAHPGIGIDNALGTLCWADLSTPDAEKSSEFYSGLFGWQITKGERDPSDYLHIHCGGRPIGGIQCTSERNPKAPPHWLVYFLVADCDESAAKAKAAGARFFVEPMTIEGVGRMAVVADPAGAVFAMFQGR